MAKKTIIMHDHIPFNQINNFLFNAAAFKNYLELSLLPCFIDVDENRQ
jgi:hypothetical protein